MLHMKSTYRYVFYAIISSVFILTACSKDDNPVEVTGNNSRVQGRISTSQNSPSVLGKTNGAENTADVQGATVILAQAQADGSLKTVSTQSVQTDVNGKFTVETKLNDTRNLIVVAEKGTAKWKAVVSSEVKNGTTCYAPPLNTESTTEADLFIKLVANGSATIAENSDVKVLLNGDAAAKIYNNDAEETEFADAVEANSQATVQAAGNSYFGFSQTQLQAIIKAKADAQAKLDEDLYVSDATQDEVDSHMKAYEDMVISANTTNNIKVRSYAELMRISLSNFTKVSSSIDADAHFSAARCYYKRFAFVLDAAIREQFFAAGASSAQINSAGSAGTTLYTAIKNSTDMNQIDDAFVQYHSSIKSQLKVVLSGDANVVDSVDATFNSSGGAKTILSAALNVAGSFDSFINAYIAFYNNVRSNAQASFHASSTAQANAAASILVLTNMN